MEFQCIQRTLVGEVHNRGHGQDASGGDKEGDSVERDAEGDILRCILNNDKRRVRRGGRTGKIIDPEDVRFVEREPHRGGIGRHRHRLAFGAIGNESAGVCLGGPFFGEEERCDSQAKGNSHHFLS